MVDFWAEWCGHVRLSPRCSRISRRNPRARVTLAKVQRGREPRAGRPLSVSARSHGPVREGRKGRGPGDRRSPRRSSRRNWTRWPSSAALSPPGGVSATSRVRATSCPCSPTAGGPGHAVVRLLRLRPGPIPSCSSPSRAARCGRATRSWHGPLMVLSARTRQHAAPGATQAAEAADRDPLEALRRLLTEFQAVAVPGCRASRGRRRVPRLRHGPHMERAAEASARRPRPADTVFMFSDTLLVFDNLRHRLLVIATRTSTSATRCRSTAPTTGPPCASHDSGEAGAAHAGHAALALPPTAPRVARAKRASPRRWTSPRLRGRARGKNSSRPATPTRSCWPAARHEARVRPVSRSPPLRTINPSRTCSTCVWVTRRPSSALARGAGARGGRPGGERPIAGTHPRGATEAEDKAIERMMATDPKERAST